MYVYRTLKVAVISLPCRVGSIVAMLGSMDSSNDDLIVAALILSVMVQIMLVYWIWMDAGAVCVWNPFYWISKHTNVFIARRSRMKCTAFNNSQTHST